jgi:O-antigen/teichoic acid export membrane protein
MTVASETQPVPFVRRISSKLLGLIRSRAFWVLADQGIVSVGNFLTGTYLIKSLSVDEYGAFDVLFQTMLYLNSLQSALVIYPLLVRGATANEKTELGRLANSALLMTLGLLPLLGGVMVIAIGCIEIPQGWTVYVSAVLALVLWQLQETMRRGLTADLRFSEVVWGDGISYLGQAGLIVLMWRLEALTLNRVYVIMAATSVAATLLQAYQIGLRSVSIPKFKTVVVDFWVLGRWMLLSNASGAVSVLSYGWSLLFWHGTAFNAIFGAINYAFKLANPIMNSMSNLITPAVARAAATGGVKASTRTALRYAALGAAMLLPFYAMLLIFATPILQFLSKGGSEGDKPYADYAYLLRLFVANSVAVYLNAVIGSWLQGLGKSRYNFYCQIASMSTTVVISLPLIWKYDVNGLVIGGLISVMSSTSLAAYFIFKHAYRAEHQDAPPAQVAS